MASQYKAQNLARGQPRRKTIILTDNVTIATGAALAHSKANWLAVSVQSLAAAAQYRSLRRLASADAHGSGISVARCRTPA
jgi:hypothetical protein